MNMGKFFVGRLHFKAPRAWRSVFCPAIRPHVARNQKRTRKRTTNHRVCRLLLTALPTVPRSMILVQLQLFGDVSAVLMSFCPFYIVFLNIVYAIQCLFTPQILCFHNKESLIYFGVLYSA